MNIYHQIVEEQQRLVQQITSLEKKIAKLPDGKLISVHNGKYVKWDRSDGHSNIYLSKKEQVLAQQLAQKKYYLALRKHLLHETTALNAYLKHHSCGVPPHEKLLEESSTYYNLLAPLFAPEVSEFKKWMDGPYEKNTKHSEHLTHKTLSGHLVRSKSEVMICNCLYHCRIPFRYESLLLLGNLPAYPDFTIKHPSTGMQYYWEHFGMMDDPVYCRNYISKIQSYTSNGILPGIHLICTYESKNHPLTQKQIESTISQFFDVKPKY